MYSVFMIVLLQIETFAENSFNFPLQAGQANTIFLQDYTPQNIEGPFYELKRSEEFTFNIQQSSMLLQEGELLLNGKILSASNYNAQSQLTSNNFLFLTKSNLYFGQLENNGSLTVNQKSIDLSKLNCFQINSITTNYGMLSCIKQDFLNFGFVNVSNQEIITYTTNFTFPSKFSNRKVEIQYKNSETLYIYLTFVADENAYIICFSYYKQLIELISHQSYNGSYSQLVLSQDFNYLFLMSKRGVYLVNLVTNQSYGEIINHQQTKSSLSKHFTKIAVLQIQSNLFRIVTLQKEYLSSLFFDTQVMILSQNSIHFKLNPYEKAIQLQTTFNSIYVVTNNYLTKLSQTSKIQPLCNMNYSFANMALIQIERNVAILINTEQSSTKFESILLNSPQIQIDQTQTQLIVSNQQTVKLRINIISQFSRQIEESFTLNIVIQDISKSQCPMLFKEDLATAQLIYPSIYPINSNFPQIGPNITTVIKSSDSKYVTVQKSSVAKYATTQNDQSYSALCTQYRSYTITCSQNGGDVIISYSLSISSINTYFLIPVNFNQNLVQCICQQSKTSIEIIMQFTTNVLIQNIDYKLDQKGLIQYQFSQEILSTAYIQDTLFVVTNDNILSAYSQQKTTEPKFTIQNYNFNQIYLNRENYPNYLFIDNQLNLVILSYYGQQSCELVNIIEYPLTTYNQLKLGILNQGIYMAFINQANNIQLFYYPEQYIYVDKSYQTYMEIDLMGFQFAFANLSTAYTQRNFYIILYKSTLAYWAQYQPSGSAFTSLSQSKYIQAYSSQNYISYISAVEYLQDQQIIDYLQIQTTSSNSNLIKYSITDWSAALSPKYFAGQLMVQTSIQYNSSNQYCYSLQYQDVNIVYDKQLIIPRLIDSEKHEINLSSNQSQFQVNPLELFNGNIVNYTASCNNCQNFSYNQPISSQNQYGLNINIQSILTINDTFLYVQNNLSLYIMNYQTGEYNALYNFPTTPVQCSYLFMEIVTQFPISICNNQRIYSYNQTSGAILSYDISNYSTIYFTAYNNGLLQLFTKSNSQLNYYVFYLQIVDDQIILTQVFSYLKFAFTLVDQIILKLSTNFTSDPCQIIGFSNIEGQNTNPKFYILKTCISSQLAQYYGFQSTLYTKITNIYFNIQEWMLFETQIIRIQVFNYLQQNGNPLLIRDDASQISIVCPYDDDAKIYKIQFNLTDGKILGFFLQGTLFLDFASTYHFRCNGDFILVAYYVQVLKNYTINTYIYSTENLLQLGMQIIPYVGSLKGAFNSQFFEFRYQGNYLAFSGTYEKRSQIHYIQNCLSFNTNLQENELQEIEILAINDQSQFQRSLFVTNQQNNDDNDDDDNDDDDNNDDDNNDDDNDDDDDNNDDDNNDDEDEINSKEDSKSHLILYICIGVILIIVLIIIVVYYCKKSQIQKQGTNEMSYQLV